ncbi:hypothetical protein FVE85_9638 [Porphyridium purpureum]|uniref:Uncharacterized protein n=1 Tax=Porphyridium purpureum TaxID=35688 RepID=A0A5J4YJG9_PORPP|nr:hypothetical protein FVE85_9638 [Porphyridium purpureum]|eukprot:POR1106..scf246_12
MGSRAGSKWRRGSKQAADVDASVARSEVPFFHDDGVDVAAEMQAAVALASGQKKAGRRTVPIARKASPGKREMRMRVGEVGVMAEQHGDDAAPAQATTMPNVTSYVTSELRKMGISTRTDTGFDFVFKEVETQLELDPEEVAAILAELDSQEATSSKNTSAQPSKHSSAITLEHVSSLPSPEQVCSPYNTAVAQELPSTESVREDEEPPFADKVSDEKRTSMGDTDQRPADRAPASKTLSMDSKHLSTDSKLAADRQGSSDARMSGSRQDSASGAPSVVMVQSSRSTFTADYEEEDSVQVLDFNTMSEDFEATMKEAYAKAEWEKFQKTLKASSDKQIDDEQAVSSKKLPAKMMGAVIPGIKIFGKNKSNEPESQQPGSSEDTKQSTPAGRKTPANERGSERSTVNSPLSPANLPATSSGPKNRAFSRKLSKVGSRGGGDSDKDDVFGAMNEPRSLTGKLSRKASIGLGGNDADVPKSSVFGRRSARVSEAAADARGGDSGASRGALAKKSSGDGKATAAASGGLHATADAMQAGNGTGGVPVSAQASPVGRKRVLSKKFGESLMRFGSSGDGEKSSGMLGGIVASKRLSEPNASSSRRPGSGGTSTSSRDDIVNCLEREGSSGGKKGVRPPGLARGMVRQASMTLGLQDKADHVVPVSEVASASGLLEHSSKSWERRMRKSAEKKKSGGILDELQNSSESMWSLTHSKRSSATNGSLQKVDVDTLLSDKRGLEYLPYGEMKDENPLKPFALLHNAIRFEFSQCLNMIYGGAKATRKGGVALAPQLDWDAMQRAYFQWWSTFVLVLSEVFDISNDVLFPWVDANCSGSSDGRTTLTPERKAAQLKLLHFAKEIEADRMTYSCARGIIYAIKMYQRLEKQVTSLLGGFLEYALEVEAEMLKLGAQGGVPGQTAALARSNSASTIDREIRDHLLSHEQHPVVLCTMLRWMETPQFQAAHDRWVSNNIQAKLRLSFKLWRRTADKEHWSIPASFPPP